MRHPAVAFDLRQASAELRDLAVGIEHVTALTITLSKRVGELEMDIGRLRATVRKLEREASSKGRGPAAPR